MSIDNLNTFIITNPVGKHTSVTVSFLTHDTSGNDLTSVPWDTAIDGAVLMRSWSYTADTKWLPPSLLIELCPCFLIQMDSLMSLKFILLTVLDDQVKDTNHVIGWENTTQGTQLVDFLGLHCRSSLRGTPLAFFQSESWSFLCYSDVWQIALKLWFRVITWVNTRASSH